MKNRFNLAVTGKKDRNRFNTIFSNKKSGSFLDLSTTNNYSPKKNKLGLNNSLINKRSNLGLNSSKYNKKKMDLNWNQAKKRYPKLNKYKDNDFDGTLNYKDCKPFDPSRDGPIGDFISNLGKRIKEYRTKRSQSKVNSVKKRLAAEKRLQRFSKNVAKKERYDRSSTAYAYGNVLKEKEKVKERAKKNRIKSIKKGYTQTMRVLKNEVRDTRGSSGKKKKGSKGKTYQLFGVTYRPNFNKSGSRKKSGVGRPKGNYRHRDPFTNQPVHVYVWRKRMRQYRKLLAQKADMNKLQRVKQLARRGVAPTVARQVIQAKQEAYVERQLPSQYEYDPQRGKVYEEQMTNPEEMYSEQYTYQQPSQEMSEQMLREQMIREKIKRLPPGYVVTKEGRVLGPPRNPSGFKKAVNMYNQAKNIINKTNTFFKKPEQKPYQLMEEQ